MKPRAGNVGRALIAVALLAAGGYGCYQGFATTLVRVSPPTVLVMGRKETPTGQAAVAQMSLALGNLRGSVEAANRSLALRPLDPATLRTLALARLRLGKNEQAAKDMTLASQLGWRDKPTQKLLLGFALNSGSITDAAIRIDALGRQRDDYPTLFESARAMLLLPGAPRALAERLAENPGWRTDFLKSTDLLSPATYPAWIAMLGELTRLGTPPTAEESAVFEGTLIAKDQPAVAIVASRKFGALRKPVSADLGEVAQGSDLSPFTWSVLAGREGLVSQDRSGAITVTGEGQSTDPYIRRVFPVTLGRHALRMTEKPGSPDSLKAFRWMVTCLPSGTELSAARTTALAKDGTALSLAFTVPQGCPAVRVALAGEKGQIPGNYSVSYFDLHLQ